ncbi:MAG: ABC transporter ATP-binding protein [Anaerolineaceae bacterium]|nr:ABC transporter ATP-binding protein [Anaerolineaceae bacterium]
MSDQNGLVSVDYETILRVRNLHAYFYTEIGVAKALNGVSFDVPARKVMGVVGESGCGKSVTALSCMRLIQRPGRIIKGDITLYSRKHNANKGGEVVEEIDLLSLDQSGQQMRSIRGAEMAMIFQEPMTSLNPSYTIGNQINETIVLHQNVDQAEAATRTIKILDQVGMANPQAIYRRYPHELSGGMRQRAMIAMGLSCSPALLFADEPTTALDVTTEAQILDLMRDLQAEMGMTIVFITHNLGVVAQMCDYVAVMYLGRVVEQAAVKPIFYTPQHPYTKALLNSIPHAGSGVHARLQPIRGIVPDPYSSIRGCPFHLRCASYMPGKCDKNVPAITTIEEGHTVRCFLYSDEVEE